MHSSLEEPFRYSPTSVVVTTGSTESIERQTRQEISTLVAEMGELSRSEIEPAAFWPEFANRLHRAMAAEWIVVWTLKQQGLIALVTQSGDAVDDAAAGLASNRKTLQQVVESQRPVLIPPSDSGAAEGIKARESNWSALVPLVNYDDACIVIECGLKDVGGPASQRGYLRFVAQMSDLANEYLRSCALKRWRRESSVWQLWEQSLNKFAQLQSSADFHRLAVDTCARALNISRVSWFSRHPWGWKLQASSGIDVPDARGPAAKWLAGQIDSQLTLNNQRINQPALQTKDNPTGLELVSTIPLYWPKQSSQPWKSLDDVKSNTTGSRSDTAAISETRFPFAVLLVQHHERAWSEQQQQWAETFARGIAGAYRAIGLAESIPGLGKYLLKRDISMSWRRPLISSLALFVLTLVLILIPFPLKVTAPATLEPVGVVQIQAPRNGMVKRLLVEHDQEVKAGTPLAEMWDVELDRNEEQLLGQQSILEKRNAELQRLIVRNTDPNRRNEWESERAEIEVERRSVAKQLEWIQHQRATLSVVSPIDGRIVAWNAKQQIVGKQVQRGEPLLEVIDRQGAWRIRCEFPQSRLDHLSKSLTNNSRAPATVVFHAFPNHPVAASFSELGPTTLKGRDGLPVGWSDMEVEADALPFLQPGAAATVAIDCGYRPLGYVLFQDLIRTTIGWWRLWHI